MYTTTAGQSALSAQRVSAGERRRVIGPVAFFVQRVLSLVRRAMCSLSGHDLMMEFAPNRLSLRCAACGHNTPGWALDVKMPPVPRRPRIRVVARTALPGVETPVKMDARPVKMNVKTQPLSVASHAADHAHAA
jgi:hypothetical protein